MKRLTRSTKDHILGGVCGGMGKYMDIDPVLIRLIWVLFTFCAGFAILLYIIAWIIIPKEITIDPIVTKEPEPEPEPTPEPELEKEETK